MACQNFIEIPYLLEGVHTLMSPQRVIFATPIRLNANANECYDRSSIESMHRSDINWANRIVDSHISGTSRSAGAQPVFESITMTIFLQHRTGILCAGTPGAGPSTFTRAKRGTRLGLVWVSASKCAMLHVVVYPDRPTPRTRAFSAPIHGSLVNSIRPLRRLHYNRHHLDPIRCSSFPSTH